MDAWQVLKGMGGIASHLRIDHPFERCRSTGSGLRPQATVSLEGFFGFGSAWESTAQALIQNDRTRFECLLGPGPT